MKSYFHMFANGSEARNFITNEEEMKAAFNRIGVCSSLTQAEVVSFSIEDSHPHALLWGTLSECQKFKEYYENISIRSIARRRGSLDGVRLRCELYEVTDQSYLMNVAAYTIIQPTKDGKAIMPFDYLYGSGALYFRSNGVVFPWMIDNEGKLCQVELFKNLKSREKRRICGSTILIPGDWTVCNGFILPTNYIDIIRFQNIYKTHNCYRVFLSSGRDKYKEVLDKMVSVRGIMIDDIEARSICERTCAELFKHKGTRHVTPEQRLELATERRIRYHISIRQISTMVKVPEEEIRDYLR